MSDTINIRNLGSGAIGILEQEIVKRDATIAELRKENAFLRSWLRGELTITDAEIDAMRAEIAETEAAYDAAMQEGNHGSH